jgi:hypothetical protein
MMKRKMTRPSVCDLEEKVKDSCLYMRKEIAGCSLQTDAALKKSGRGSYDYRVEMNENIVLLKWVDNKAVHLISTYKRQEPLENVRRWSVAAKHVNVPRPAIVKEYDTFMGDVDLHDMLVPIYRK